MPYYKPLLADIRQELDRYGLFTEARFNATRNRIVDKIRALRDRIGSQIPKRNLSETLLVGTWNLREFDSEKFGPRTVESYYYIAEILSAFDLIAVQEVRDNLNAIRRVMQILGPWWKILVTDVTDGPSGNGERLAFLYDERKVRHTGLAGEVVLPAIKGTPQLQFARTPFVCGFQAAWCQFSLCTVHIYYGVSKPNDPRRVKEIDDFADLLAKRAEGVRLDRSGRPFGARIEPENMVVLGDFNIFGLNDPTMRGLLDNGFTVPDALLKRPGSNLDQSKFYDQIAFMIRPARFETTGRAGVFKFTEVVFGDDEESTYTELMNAIYSKTRSDAGKQEEQKSINYRMWRTYQISDHFPLWVELRTDFTDPYLERVRRTSADGQLTPEEPTSEDPEKDATEGPTTLTPKKQKKAAAPKKRAKTPAMHKKVKSKNK